MTHPKSRLPDFVVIGAAKAATTWAANQLRARPDVFIPGPEPHYFSSEFHRGEDWYRSWFNDAAPTQRVAEKSADYLAHPDAPKRMAALLPDARLVVQLRNPIERAYSDYCMYFRRGTVDGDARKYLSAPHAEFPRFLVDGLYHEHIQRFLDHYPRSAIEIIFYDDIKARPQEVIGTINAFLGLPELAEPLAMVERANVKDAPMLPLALRKTLAPAKELVAPLRSKSWFRKLHATLAREVVYPPLTPDLRQSLADYYASDVEELGAMLGRNLTPWLRS